MSPTAVPDLTDDAVDRALRADAEQWRVSHPAPSLDDAVRRLVAEAGAPARHRRGWWRPLAAAAAVLLLIAGVTVVVTHRHRPAAPQVAAPSAPAHSSTLSGVPSGFRSVTGHVPAPVDSAQGPGPSARHLPTTVRSWVSDRTLGSGSPMMDESLVLIVTQLAKDRRIVVMPATPWTVQGNMAHVSTQQWPLRFGSSQTAIVVTVQWTEGDTGIELMYSGPASGSASGRPLTEAEVVAIAQTYQPGSSSTGSSPVHPAVPVTVAAGSTSLVLEETRSFSARRGTGGELLVSLRGGPSTNPLTASHCNPYEQAVLTGATATTVTVTVGVYAPTTGRDLPCTAESYANRWVPVPLDGPLGARTVVDGSTGEPVALSAS